MNLFKILRLECSAVDIELKDKSDALHEVARLAKQCAVFDHVSEEVITRGLEEREKIGRPKVLSLSCLKCFIYRSISGAKIYPS